MQRSTMAWTLSTTACVFFFLLAFAAADTNPAPSPTAPHVFHFAHNKLKFTYPYHSAERTHCINISEPVAYKSYSSLVHGALNNPRMLRKEMKLPIKLQRVRWPELALAYSEDEEGGDSVPQTGSLSDLARAPLSQGNGSFEVALTHNRLLNVTTYPDHMLTQLGFGSCAAMPGLSPFEVGLQTPLSVEFGTRFHARLFSILLTPIDFQLKLSVIVRARTALCLLPEVKFAHRNNAADVRLQSLGMELLDMEWTVPLFGRLANFFLSFWAFVASLIVRILLGTRWLDMNQLVAPINNLLVEKANFTLFTTTRNYEAVLLQDIQQVVENVGGTPSDAAAEEDTEEEDVDYFK